ncbi:hypothetical protein GCM10007874_59910 [Labrys miyagiensis]|uniref:Uncharacterized protein n=1 Tax=Labrys miyagiensis TaxID=346912 RepID=A0ABQ6CXL1_9HYPH|nr:hypothetical protein [Labrys miyagiensis]GLS22971.1 hypothetical protein GCM10007874_59910 [Labrys miyagiensis]
MAEETKKGPMVSAPANDNTDPAEPNRATKDTVREKLDRIALDTARLIGGQLAREAFEKQRPANDNRSGRREEEGRGRRAKPPADQREDDPP